jgi:hypothetical protein
MLLPAIPYVGEAFAVGVGLLATWMLDEAVDEECREKECDRILEKDNETCDAIWRAEPVGKRPKGAARRCYAAAMERYGNCLAGRDSGPLDTWNN